MLAPFFSDFEINGVISPNTQTITIGLLSAQKFSICPICKQPSARIHSSYSRTLMDLPILGATVSLEISSRKFFCDNDDCERKIFTERFQMLIEPYARQTTRLKEALTILAFSSNAKTNSKVAEELSFAISPSTLLRIARKTVIEVNENAKIIGIDDFAFRKGHNYGTIICDLETHRPIALLEDRETETLKQWLKEHPDIQIATRDRAKNYAKALKEERPEVIQIADRFHLLQNLLEAVKEFAKTAFSP